MYRSLLFYTSFDLYTYFLSFRRTYLSKSTDHGKLCRALSARVSRTLQERGKSLQTRWSAFYGVNPLTLTNATATCYVTVPQQRRPIGTRIKILLTRSQFKYCGVLRHLLIWSAASNTSVSVARQTFKSRQRPIFILSVVSFCWRTDRLLFSAVARFLCVFCFRL